MDADDTVDGLSQGFLADFASPIGYSKSEDVMFDDAMAEMPGGRCSADARIDVPPEPDTS